MYRYKGLTIRIAKHEEVRYACLHYHYAKKIPAKSIAYSIFNSDGLFCGCVVYGTGANNNLAKSLGVRQGQVLELVRVALNGKHNSPNLQTSSVVSATLRMLSKDQPLVKSVVSYADTSQGHLGKIYQAMNWLYLGISKSSSMIDPKTGEIVHARTIDSKYGTAVGIKSVTNKIKHKYLYILDKSLKINLTNKSYPKMQD